MTAQNPMLAQARQPTNSPSLNRIAPWTALAALLLVLTGCGHQGSPTVQPALPPIDLAAPRHTETATFALG